MKKYLEILILPVVYILFALCIGYTWKLLDLPSPETFIPVLNQYFDQYGIYIVFAVALIESAFVIGSWAPGGLVIFMGVIFSIGDPGRAAAVVLSVIVAFAIGYTIDYVLGKYGWYKLLAHFGFVQALENTKRRIQKYGLSIPWLGYSIPDFGTLISTAYGVLGYSYKQFLKLSVLPIIFWCMFWGTFTYMLGEKALSVLGWNAVIVILAVWVTARAIEVRFLNKESN